MQKKIYEILNEINEEILSYDGENMFDDGLIDSFQAVDLINELEDAFDIEIDASYVTEENLKTKEAIVAMVEKIMEM